MRMQPETASRAPMTARDQDGSEGQSEQRPAASGPESLRQSTSVDGSRIIELGGAELSEVSGGTKHTGAVTALFCDGSVKVLNGDGSVRFVSDGIDSV